MSVIPKIIMIVIIIVIHLVLAMNCVLQMAFQRAARTDKGVSAAGQVVSLKISVCLLVILHLCH